MAVTNIQAAPIVHWNLNEASGQTFLDGSGNNITGYLGNTGTVEVSDPVWETTQEGGGLRFAVDGQKCTADSNALLNNLTSFTYIAWIYPSDWGQTDYGRILSKETTTEADFYLLLRGANQSFGVGILNTAGTTFQATAQAGSILLERWQRVAVTYDDAVDRKPHLYLNGHEVGGYYVQSTLTGTLKTTANALIIGNRKSGTSGDRTFHGVIDEVKVYDKALTAAELLDEFNAFYRLSSVYSTSPVTMDGNLSEPIWALAGRKTFSDRPGGNDNRINVCSTWDGNNLYLAFEVTDASLEAINGELDNDDGTEVFLDVGHEKSAGLDANDRHYVININNFTSDAKITARTINQTTGYTMEVAIPWSTALGVNPAPNKVMGLLLANNDRDGGVSTPADWQYLVDRGAWEIPSLWGEITLAAPAMTDQIVSLRTTTPIILDGILGETGWGQTNLVAFSNAGRSDNLTKVYTLWDDTNLYFAFDVTDAQLEATGALLYKDDGGEVFLDTLNNKSNVLDSDDCHYIVTIGHQVEAQNGGAIQVSAAAKSGGYVLEMAVPWSSVNVDPSTQKVMGLLLGNNDRDGGVGTQYDWLNLIETGSYSRPYLWGDIILSEFAVVAGDKLKWISATALDLLTNTKDNLVGQINLVDVGADTLQSVQVRNQGTAQSARDIAGIKLWYRSGGGKFNPYLATPLGQLGYLGGNTWGQSGLSRTVNNGDAFYLTADIGVLAQVGQTCQLVLPAGGMVFQNAGGQDQVILENLVTQVIRRNVEYTLDYVPAGVVNVARGEHGVDLGEIGIVNQSGKALDLVSFLITVRSPDGTDLGPGEICDRLWYEEGTQVVSEIAEPFLTDGYFIFEPPRTLADKTILRLRLRADIKTSTAVRQFQIGVADNQALNGGLIWADPVSGQGFPLLSTPINIREPSLRFFFSNYPNPFRPGREVTHIPYYLETSGSVVLEIWTVNGELVKRFEAAEHPAGRFEAAWDGRNNEGRGVKSGVYLLRLVCQYADGRVEKLTRKIGLVR